MTVAGRRRALDLTQLHVYDDADDDPALLRLDELSPFPYDGKEQELVGVPVPNIAGSASTLVDQGERSDRVFPPQ